MWPTLLTQGLQVQTHKRIIFPSLAGQQFRAPLPQRVIDAVPWLQGLTARVAGLGFRPEHVEIAAAQGRVSA